MIPMKEFFAQQRKYKPLSELEELLEQAEFWAHDSHMLHSLGAHTASRRSHKLSLRYKRRAEELKRAENGI